MKTQVVQVIPPRGRLVLSTTGRAGISSRMRSRSTGSQIRFEASHSPQVHTVEKSAFHMVLAPIPCDFRCSMYRIAVSVNGSLRNGTWFSVAQSRKAKLVLARLLRLLLGLCPPLGDLPRVPRLARPEPRLPRRVPCVRATLGDLRLPRPISTASFAAVTSPSHTLVASERMRGLDFSLERVSPLLGFALGARHNPKP